MTWFAMAIGFVAGGLVVGVYCRWRERQHDRDMASIMQECHGPWRGSGSRGKLNLVVPPDDPDDPDDDIPNIEEE